MMLNLKNHYTWVPLLMFFVLSCSDGTQVEQSELNIDQSELTISDLGLKTIQLHISADFEDLRNLRLTKIGSTQYLSFSDWRSKMIHIYDYASGAPHKIIKLKDEGPHGINILVRLNHFIHSLDSIFIDGQTPIYYIINDKAEVLKRISKLDNSKDLGVNGSPMIFDLATHFANNQIHGAYEYQHKSPYKKKAFVYARASLDIESGTEVSKSIKNESYISSFNEAQEYQDRMAEKDGLFHIIPKHFVRDSKYLYGTSPISDSISVFEEGRLIHKFFAGYSGYDVTDYKKYLNGERMTWRPGRLRVIVAAKQPPFFINTLIDPDGKYIYRLLLHGTKAAIDEDTGDEIPKLIGATLLAIDLNTYETLSLELPIEKLDLKLTRNTQIFASIEGVNIRAKDQENEDEVQFRVFGIGSL